MEDGTPSYDPKAREKGQPGRKVLLVVVACGWDRGQSAIVYDSVVSLGYEPDDADDSPE